MKSPVLVLVLAPIPVPAKVIDPFPHIQPNVKLQKEEGWSSALTFHRSRRKRDPSARAAVGGKRLNRSLVPGSVVLSAPLWCCLGRWRRKGQEALFIEQS
jgi:hypothetical protein